MQGNIAAFKIIIYIMCDKPRFDMASLADGTYCGWKERRNSFLLNKTRLPDSDIY